MALKDWKKSPMHENGWQKKYGTGNGSVRIGKNPNVKGVRKWWARITGGSYFFFKTKSAALAYAKSYMRKH